MSGSRLLAVLVSRNSAGLVGHAVSSLPDGVPVVVVDNDSSDRSVEEAEEAGAEVVRAAENLGFGPACNLGARTGPGAGSETILFLNPDAELLDGATSLAALLAELDHDDRVAAVAPALAGPGQERFQLRRLPTLGSIAREALLLNRLFPRSRGLLRERYLDRPRDSAFDVEQPAAAALLVRRDLFERLGGFDPRFVPAWFEDVDLCARILDSGHRIRFVPEARGRHLGGSALRSIPYRDFVPLYTRNLVLYLRLHWAPARRGVARALLCAGALLRLAALAFTTGDHDRAQTAHAYLRVLRGLLGLGWRSALLPHPGA